MTTPNQENLLPAELPKKLLTKSDDYEISSYGKKPTERSMEELIEFGVINVDKHANPTSQEIVALVKRILDLKKAGHSGTLDPAVTGVLPIALESATKITKALLEAGKEYMVVMHLHENVSKEELAVVFDQLTGKIYQRPPVKSSVKRVLRVREIYYLDFLELVEKNVLFKVGCQKGTYIRKLCHDMGLLLGCGAHMKELRRTKTGPFKEDETLASLTRVYDAHAIWKESGDEEALRKIIFPMERALSFLPKFIVRDSAIGAICHGANLAVPGVVKLHDNISPGDLTLIESLKGEAIALAEATMNTETVLKENSGIAANLNRVLMPRDVYPKAWKD
jgi:H/ACA ribonucleoprotein complex subunit 4